MQSLKKVQLFSEHRKFHRKKKRLKSVAFKLVTDTQDKKIVNLETFVKLFALQIFLALKLWQFPHL